MPEQQNIEYKQSWHDDYLKWVCDFANAQGGLIPDKLWALWRLVYKVS